jgi:hypothetical protein
MSYANESRVWVALTCLVTLALGLLFAMGVASHAGSSVYTVVCLGVSSVTFAAVAAHIAVKFSRP